MRNDPIVAEVRKNRAQLAKRFRGDVKAIVNDARRRQNASKQPIVSFIRECKESGDKSLEIEIKRRVGEIKRGKTRGKPAESVLAENRARYS